MSELKITVEQLRNYLGTGIKFMTSKHQIQYGKTHVINLNGISFESNGDFNLEFLYDDDLLFSNRMNKVYPICYRLSDLDKEIEMNGERFVPIEKISIYDPSNKVYLIEQILIGMVEKIVWDQLIDMHFWTFGDKYFEQGLVIDKMKIK